MSEIEIAKSPSKLAVITAMKIKKIELNRLTKKRPHITLIKASTMGEKLGKEILYSRPEVKENMSQLENPSSYEDYFDALPNIIRTFFQALLTVLQQHKLKTVNNKRRQRGLPLKSLDINQITKITTLLTSTLLTIAFPGAKIWLSTIISSICQNPKLLPYLREILRSASVIAYTKRHESRLEKLRIHHIDPRNNLIEGSNVWNLAVIDNIDFKASTFSYGNIFDIERQTSHATLRMVFQFILPTSLDYLVDDYEYIKQPLFGESSTTDNLLLMYEATLNRMLESHVNDFEMEDVHFEIAKQIPLGCNIPPPKIVILKPGDPPNCNENVHSACEMYRDELPHGCDERLYIACDQAIFGRLTSYKETHSDVRLLLGQWHTSKDMCSTLITIFSGYGIFNLAAVLGVRYLEKFEHVVDYRATCRVLELIWVAVGIALRQHVKREKKTMNEILNSNNYLIKIWYLFFRWTGYFIGHKIGIRRGNYRMQMANLAAFAPLFPAAGKFRYASSVAHFLAQVHEDLQLQKLLQIACSVNLTSEGHYFAFDEALETYGVKFVKQNMTGNVTDQETMMLKIKAVQSERERLSVLLAEYVDDIVMSQNARAIKSRKDSLWFLVANLSSAFDSPDPTTHYLFEDAPEINKEGVENIFSFYETGKLRFQEVLEEDVYKTKPRTSKRRVRNINRYTYAQLESIKKQKRRQIDDSIQESIFQQNTQQAPSSSSSAPNPLKRSRRTTSEIEKTILAPLFELEGEDTILENEIQKVLVELQTVSSDWSEARIKQYLRNNRKNVQK